MHRELIWFWIVVLVWIGVFCCCLAVGADCRLLRCVTLGFDDVVLFGFLGLLSCLRVCCWLYRCLVGVSCVGCLG